MTKEILIKFLNNRCNNTELNEVIRWVNTEALSNKGKALALDDWEKYEGETNMLNDDKFSELFDKIQRKIDSKTGKDIQKKQSVTIRTVTSWLTKAAAIFLIPVLAFLFYTLSENKIETNIYANITVDTIEVISPIGSRTVVQLSDGSVVHLNYGSKIKYPQFFTGDTREIVLIGEGYFDVAHNPEKPFVVKTKKINIKALGTAFNVLAYPDDVVVETTLVNGKVVLEKNEPDGNIKTIGSMKPNQHVSYNCNTGAVLSTQGDVNKYIAWKDGKLVFEDAYITEVADRLSRMFNVDIEVDNDIKEYFYTVTFVDEPLFQILELMTIATPIKYEALPRKKMADGTFSKQKIVLKKRK